MERSLFAKRLRVETDTRIMIHVIEEVITTARAATVNTITVITAGTRTRILIPILTQTVTIPTQIVTVTAMIPDLEAVLGQDLV